MCLSLPLFNRCLGWGSPQKAEQPCQVTRLNRTADSPERCAQGSECSDEHLNDNVDNFLFHNRLFGLESLAVERLELLL